MLNRRELVQAVTGTATLGLLESRAEALEERVPPSYDLKPGQLWLIGCESDRISERMARHRIWGKDAPGNSIFEVSTGKVQDLCWKFLEGTAEAYIKLSRKHLGETAHETEVEFHAIALWRARELPGDDRELILDSIDKFENPQLEVLFELRGLAQLCAFRVIATVGPAWDIRNPEFAFHVDRLSLGDWDVQKGWPVLQDLPALATM